VSLLLLRLGSPARWAMRVIVDGDVFNKRATEEKLSSGCAVK